MAERYDTDQLRTAAVPADETDHLEIRFGASLVHLATVRAATVNIAMRAEFTLDAISDLELAVDECCSSLITRAIPGSVLTCQFTIGADAIAVLVSVPSADGHRPSTSTFGWQVLTTLTDQLTASVEQGAEGQHVVSVEMVKRRPVGVG